MKIVEMSNTIERNFTRMLKIFTTQLQGHFNRIMEQEEMNMEDGARTLPSLS